MNILRVRQLRLLTFYLPRSMPLALLVGGAVTAGLLVATGRTQSLPLHVRLAAACLAAGVASVLPDTAAATTASSPTSLLVRRVMRLAPCVVLVAVSWVAVLTVAERRAPGFSQWSGPYTLELVTLSVLGLAVAALVDGAGDGRDGAAGLVGVVTVAAAATSSHLINAWWWPLLSPDAPGSMARLVGVALVSAGMFVASSAPRRPA